MKTIKTHTWKVIGLCAMDTAGLLIADPCYVMNQNRPQELEINDYNVWIKSKKEVTNLLFKRGHEGAGVIVHSPNGDGSVEIWGKMDCDGRIKSVFFSFDGESPK